MTNITRDEFETVKELLGSAARYAESAHRRLDRLEMTDGGLSGQAFMK